MPISYDFEFYHTFNYQIMKLKESGVLQYIVKTYENKYGGISRNCENLKRQKGSPIDMHTIITPVIFFIGGASISLLFLIIENCWKFGKKAKVQKPADLDYNDSTGNTTDTHISHLSVNSVRS